jgi:hypothetical protein
MPGHEFFERLMPRFALQVGAAKKAADRQADAERLIAGAEYECMQMRRELMAAFAVPLSHRAVKFPAVEPAVEAAPVADAPPSTRAAKAA